MTTAYRIKEVVERSGFTAPTLRYYEEIGLLPEARRTPAGYRLYDEHTLDRLAFIARAKRLGCTLDEISELSVAWDGGRCGPVQDRLRVLVAAKLAIAHRQIVELTTLATELQDAAATLERHRPDGPCDDRCGCVTEGATENAHSRPVMFCRKPDAVSNVDSIVCTLGAQAVPERLDAWRRLFVDVVAREAIDRGIRATFRASAPLDELIRLVAAEQECCRFFSFAITVDDRGVALEVRAPAEAGATVDALFGISA